MSIFDTSKIDIVGTRPGSPVIRLVIADALDWDDFGAHAELLQAKVNNYLEFIESGQLTHITNPPVPPGAQVEIVLALQYAPSTEASLFLAQIRDFLENVSISFEVEVKSITPRQDA